MRPEKNSLISDKDLFFSYNEAFIGSAFNKRWCELDNFWYLRQK